MNEQPKQRRYQFSLRGMFWLTFGVCLPLTWLQMCQWNRGMVVFVLFLVGLVAVDIYRWRRKRFG